MKTKVLVVSTISGLLLAFGALAAACGGGGGGLSLEQYFQRLDEIDDDFDRRGDELGAKLDEELASVESPEEAIQVTRDIFRDEGLPLLEDFIDELKGLEPPAEVEEAHNNAIETGTAARQALEDFIEQLEGAESEADLERLFSAGGAEAAFSSFDEACADLQTIADENNIDIDLDCED